MRSWFVLGVCGVGVAGCSKIKDVTWVPNELPGSGTVTFSSKADGDAVVRFGEAEDALDQQSPGVAASEGAVPVRGLVLGHHYFAQVAIGDKESDVIEFTVDPPPDGIPIMTQNRWEPGGSCMDGGYVLFNYIGSGKSGVAIVDRRGQYVWGVSVAPPEQVGRARPSRDGKSILYNVAHEEKSSDIAAIYRQPYEGGDPVRTRTLWGHHDFVELPDGDMAWLGYDIRLDQLYPDGVTTGCIAADTLMKGPEGMGDDETPTTLWDTWEDYEPGIYTFTGESDLFLKNYDCGDGTSPREFQHGNSMGWIDSEQSYYVNWRWLDTMVKFDASGVMQWQWGGGFNELDGADPKPEHAHFSDVWPGHVLMYDNRNSTVGSRLVQYGLTDTSYVQDAEFLAGDLSLDDPAHVIDYDDVLGDLRRIPIDGCDNLLVSFSKQGRLSEMTPDGEFVWDIGVGLGQITGRAYFLPDLYDWSGIAYRE